MASKPPLTVLILPLGADTGGVNWGMTRAFRHTDWTVHSIISGRNYIEYPVDLRMDRDLLWYWWNEADVIHLSHDFRRLRRVNANRLPPRPMVMHYHGTGFRENPGWYIRELKTRGAIGLVSTLDLWLLAAEDTEWLPAPYDLQWLGELARNSPPEAIGSPRRAETVKVAHAPTSRRIKSTEALLRAIDRLRSEGHDVELELIEKAPWKECLERKATADVYFDQVQLGYGCNAVEAWGMGIPVIAGGAQTTLTEMRGRFGGRLPFYEATEHTIYDALLEMVLSPDLRAEFSERGLEHVRRFHDERVVVEQLQDVYHRALKRG